MTITLNGSDLTVTQVIAVARRMSRLAAGDWTMPDPAA